MAGITQKKLYALFPLWSLRVNKTKKGTERIIIGYMQNGILTLEKVNFNFYYA